MADDLTADILRSEPLIRLTALFAMFGLMAAWETLAPRRPLVQPRRRRWPVNLGIVLVDTALLRLAVPAAAVGLAVLARQRGWGLFNLLGLPDWAAIALSLPLLDLAVYGQHLATHVVPVLWRLHRVHHTDLDVDVTTGLRFHPFEIVLSLFYKGAVVVALGAHPAGVLAFEVLLNASSLFNHGNVRLPAALDRAIRLVWVTPDMHRVHHSIVRRETDSNYGSCLALWDRLFRTYRAQPQAGHDRMTIGIDAFRAAADQGLAALLLLPFRRERRTPRHAAAKPATKPL